MAAVRERLPELHDQVADEVARGREVRGTDIELTVREGRDRRLGDEKLGRIGESDVSVFPYSNEERLDLLIDALRTSAETLTRSLSTLSNLLDRQEVPDRRIYFRRPESEESGGVYVPPAYDDLAQGAGIAQRLENVDRLIEADRSERGHG